MKTLRTEAEEKAKEIQGIQSEALEVRGNVTKLEEALGLQRNLNEDLQHQLESFKESITDLQGQLEQQV